MKHVIAWLLVAGGGCSGATSPVAVDNGVIVYPAADEQGQQQLFSIASEGGDPQQLTFDGQSSMPSWSPDGSRLVYVRRTDGQEPALWIMDADGGDQHQLGASGDSPDWGPGDSIVFAASPAPDQAPEIFEIGADGSGLVQLTQGGDHQGRVYPSWSSDGSHIVYMELTAQDSSDDDTSNDCPALPVQPGLWTMAADGSGAHRLTRNSGSMNLDAGGQVLNSAYDANAPDWSPAGDSIAFWSGQEHCYGQVWRIDADGSRRTQLTHEPLPSHNDDPAWSPDGRKILFSTDRRGTPEMWMMNADGSNPHFVAQNKPGPGPGQAAWQPVPR